MMRKSFSTSLLAAVLCVVTVRAGAVGEMEREAADMAAVFLKTLSDTLQQTMQTDGPVTAISVCSEQAPKIANELSRKLGWKVTRVGTRVRNPMMGMPDAWEQDVLGLFQSHADNGESVQDMTYSEVVSEPNGDYFRFMQAIVVQPRCLTCHGPVEQIPTPLRAILKERYPFDAATGYRVGELRGAVSIKYPIDRF